MRRFCAARRGHPARYRRDQMTLMETMELPRKDFIAGTVAGVAMLAAHGVLAKSLHIVYIAEVLAVRQAK